MKILLEHLMSRPETRRYQPPRGAWDECRAGLEKPPGESLGAAPLFEFAIQRVGDDVHLEGRASGGIDLQCSRCLERYRHELRESYRLRIEPAGDRRPPDPEGVRALQQHGLYLSDDLELAWYRGAEFEIDAFFAELIALAMPIKALCREECAGLCPQCGVNRNEQSCECSELQPESPFAALAALRPETERES